MKNDDIGVFLWVGAIVCAFLAASNWYDTIPVMEGARQLRLMSIMFAWTAAGLVFLGTLMFVSKDPKPKIQIVQKPELREFQ